jgi:ATP-dependent helicase/DNAse subunit B
MSFFEPGVVLILPSPLAVNKERRKLLEEAHDGVIIEPRIYTFERLSEKIASEIELEGRPLSNLGRAMIFQQILEKDEYTQGWPGRPAFPGLRRRLLDVLDYLKEGGLSEPEFLKLTNDLEAGRMWPGLAALYSDYERIIKEKQLVDRAGIRKSILEALDDKQVLRVFTGIERIMIRDFYFLTPFQVKMIKAFSRTFERVEVHLNCPEWVLGLDFAQVDNPANPFYEILALAKDIESLGTESGGLNLQFSTGNGQTSAPLSWIKENLFNPTPVQNGFPEINGHIQILAAPGRYAEVEAIGRSVFELLEQGMTPDNIAVAFNDLSAYGQLVEDVFRRFNLPLFFRRGSPLAVQAPVRAILALLRLAESHWERENVLNLLASPYLDFNITLPWPRIESLSLQAGIIDERTGETWVSSLRKLAGKRPKDRPEIEELIGAITYIKKIVESLARPQTWGEFNNHAQEILTQLKIQEKALERFRTFHIRDTAALDKLWTCLDDLESAASESDSSRVKHSPAALARGLLRAMEDQNVGQGTYQPSGVMVLDVHDLQGLRFDYLFLGGLNEGEFPHPYQESSIISDRNRRELNNKAGREVLMTSAAGYRREELLFYHALASTKKCCCLSYSRMDEDTRIMLPSALLDEIVRLWPAGSLPVEEPEREIFPTLSQVLSPEELTGRLTSDLFSRKPKKSMETELGREVLAGLLERSDQRVRWQSILDRISFEQTRESPDLDSGTGQISPESLENWLENLPEYKGAPLLSPTVMEDYGRCPFYFWVKHVLKLEPLAEAGDEISTLDEGGLVHKTLSEFLSRLSDENRLPLKGEPVEEELFFEIVNQVLDKAEDEIQVGRRPLWTIKRRAIFRLLSLWLKIEQKREDDLIPTYFEWSFGLKKENPPVEVPFLTDGRIFFQGRADQIDISTDRCRVVDYKLSRNDNAYSGLLKEPEMGLTSFQAPVYQIAAAQVFNRPGEATFYLLRTPKRLQPSMATTDEFFSLDPQKRRDMAKQGQGNFFNNVEKTWTRILAGNFGPEPKGRECAYCAHRLICRTVAVGEES